MLIGGHPRRVFTTCKHGAVDVEFIECLHCTGLYDGSNAHAYKNGEYFGRADLVLAKGGKKREKGCAAFAHPEQNPKVTLRLSLPERDWCGTFSPFAYWLAETRPHAETLGHHRVVRLHKQILPTAVPVARVARRRGASNSHDQCVPPTRRRVGRC